ncbi:MAG TPA: histidine kinase [Thermoanaerobaculia bacterium]
MRREIRVLTWLFAIAWPIAGALCLLTLPDNRLRWLTWTLLEWGVWSAFTPFVMRVIVRHPLSARPLRRVVFVHAAAVAAAGAVWYAIVTLLEWMLRDVIRCSYSLPPAYFMASALLYSTMLWAVTTLRARRAAQLAEVVRTRMSLHLSRARLDEVRTALDPRALFASLEEIERTLVRDARAAEQLVFDLCASLRAKLVPLRLHLTPAAGDAGTAAFARSRATVWSVMLVYPAYAALLVALFVVDAFVLRDSSMPWKVARNMILVHAAAGLLSPMIVFATRRFRGVSMLVLVCIAHTALSALAAELLARVGYGRPWGESVMAVFILSAGAACVGRAGEYSRRAWRSRLDSERLRQSVAEATLRSLRTQLAPHFLFNALNSVVTLIRRDAEAARQMLERLRSLLQMTLHGDGRHEVTLAEDLGVAMKYIDVERVRFREALDFRTDVDRTLLEARIPALLLQPLLENAVRHGVLSSTGRGAIRLRAARRETRLEISVENEAELLDPSAWREGIGLSNLRARLAQLYGREHALSTTVLPNGGVRVMVAIPCAS